MGRRGGEGCLIISDYETHDKKENNNKRRLSRLNQYSNKKKKRREAEADIMERTTTFTSSYLIFSPFLLRRTTSFHPFRFILPSFVASTSTSPFWSRWWKKYKHNAGTSSPLAGVCEKVSGFSWKYSGKSKGGGGGGSKRGHAAAPFLFKVKQGKKKSPFSVLFFFFFDKKDKRGCLHSFFVVWCKK